MSTVCYAQCTFNQDYADALLNAKNALGYVDHIVVVQDGSFTEEMKREFMVLDSKITTVTLVYKSWDDNFPAYRNASLKAGKELGATWFLVSDSDEHYCKEFWQDLKNKIIPDLEAKGFDMAGIRSYDAFDAIDWWDRLDELKETPAGDSRKTTYYKYLLFKLYPELEYSGVGTTKNVHESWGDKGHPWKATHLPDPYSYLHKKSSLRIWRNAARNMYIGGGGDNCGSLNLLWVELRNLTKERLNIDDWNSFEAFIAGNDDERIQILVPWIIKALIFSATDFGTETRELAKWIVWHHRYLLEITEIKYGIEHPPKPDERTETEMFVRRLYFQVLGRHPDRPGLDNYVKQVMDGTLKREQLANILKDSIEYKQKHGERVKIQAPVDVNITVTEELILEVIAKSKLYNEVYKPRMDVGKWVLDAIGDQQAFIKWFYEHKDEAMLDKEWLEKMVVGASK